MSRCLAGAIDLAHSSFFGNPTGHSGSSTRPAVLSAHCREQPEVVICGSGSASVKRTRQKCVAMNPIQAEKVRETSARPDCLSCRLWGGVVHLAAAGFVASHLRRLQGGSKALAGAFSVGEAWPDMFQSRRVTCDLEGLVLRQISQVQERQLFAVCKDSAEKLLAMSFFGF